MLLLENRCDLRHHVCHQERHDSGADAHHDDRIGQRAAHLGDEFILPLAVLGEPVQHRLERRGLFAGAHHPDVEVREDVAMIGQRVGQRRSLAHALAHLREHPLGCGARRLIAERAERIDQLHARAEQRAQLSGQERQVRRRHLAPPQRGQPLALGGLALGGVCFFVKLGGEDSLRTQLAARRPCAVGIDYAVDGTSVGAKSSISKYWHR